jgi:hypothetical protein
VVVVVGGGALNLPTVIVTLSVSRMRVPALGAWSITVPSCD